MKLYVVSTGSKANCYVLSADNGENIVLDAGVPIKKVLPHIPDVQTYYRTQKGSVFCCLKQLT